MEFISYLYIRPTYRNQIKSIVCKKGSISVFECYQNVDKKKRNYKVQNQNFNYLVLEAYISWKLSSTITLLGKLDWIEKFVIASFYIIHVIVMEFSAYVMQRLITSYKATHDISIYSAWGILFCIYVRLLAAWKVMDYVSQVEKLFVPFINLIYVCFQSKLDLCAEALFDLCTGSCRALRDFTAIKFNYCRRFIVRSYDVIGWQSEFRFNFSDVK